MKPRFLPIIRVFVSSTFGDLKAERDALQQDAFPRLEAFCRQYGFQFQAIDLRWGVPGEAGLDHRTMRICFDELHRSQDLSPEPNFLILLGDRYGWRPLPEAISKDEFNRLLAVVEPRDVPGIDSKSAERVLRDWYYQDENFRPRGPSQEPPLQYLLQSRQRDLKDGKNYGRDAKQKDTADWLAVQLVLWDLVNAAFPPDQLAGRFALDWDQHVAAVAEGRSPLPQIVHFQGSATEQEIWAGALAVPNPGGHVRAFFREITNRDDFSNPTGIKDFFDLTESGAIDEHALQAQADLKKTLADRLGDHAVTLMPHSRLKRENGRTVVDASEEDLKQLCNKVVTQLTAIIREQIKQHLALDVLPEPAASPADGEPQPVGPSEARKLELERQAHARFGEERTQQFLGRDEELDQIAAYLADDADRRPLLVHGPPGTGKTAILAEAAKRTPKNFKPIVRFLGVTPHASDLRGLLATLCRELEDRVPAETRELPAEPDKLQEELLRRLATATAQRPIVILLDALDQLSPSDGSRQLAWLPWTLPPHVRLVISCISGVADDDPLGESYRQLKRRADHQPDLLEGAIPVESLTPHDALALIDRWLEYSLPPRQLADAQRAVLKDRILPEEAIACRRPLYLRILFEECRRWPSYRPISLKKLGPDAAALLDSLLTRIQRPAEHGLTATRALGYLASARRGLSEIEILEVLWQDEDYHKYLDELNDQYGHSLPPGATRIPIALWARLRQDLAPYLAEQSAPGASVLTFYHREVGAVVRERIVAQADRKRQHHIRLADYFAKQDYFLESLQGRNAREKLSCRTLATNTLRRIKRFFQHVFRYRPVRQHDQPSRGKANYRKVEELPWQLVQSAQWTRLSHLLADPFFFSIAWESAPEDIKWYWSGLQIALPEICINGVYRDVFAAPHCYDSKFLWEAATFLQEIGHLDEALAVRRELSNRAASGKNAPLHAKALGNEAEVLRLQGKLNNAYALQLRTVRILGRQKDQLGLARALVNLALMDYILGHPDKSLRAYEKAESIFGVFGNIKGLETCKRNRAEITRDQGKFGTALQLAEESHKLAIQLNDNAARARSLGLQGDICRERGDLKRATKLLAEAEQVFRQLSDCDGLANVLCGQGLVMWERAARAAPGQDQHFLDESLRFHREEETYWRNIGDPTGVARCLANQARICGVQGLYDEAILLCEEAESFGRQSGDHIVLHIISRHKALIGRKRRTEK